MRLFYTLLASGLLILTEIPVEQPPSTAPYYAQAYSGSPSTYHSVPGYARYNESFEEHYKAHPTPMARDEVLEAGSDLFPIDFTISPTPPAATVIASRVKATYGQPSALPITGYATYYNPNVMQQVLNYRYSAGQISSCNECVGTVALLRAGDINRQVWLQWSDGTVEGPFLVVDAAASQHVNMLLARHWVVDVDNRTAVRHGMRGPVLVTVWASPPEASQVASLPLVPISYSDIPVADRQDIQASLPLGTPDAEATRLPSVSDPTGDSTVAVHGGFPTETTIPTITPLPPIYNAPSPTPTLLPSATPTATPTSTPTVVPTATRANTATNTPLPSPTVPATATPTPVTQPQAPATVLIGGFPTETVVPTMSPLPPIDSTPTSTVSSATVVPSTTPTNTPLPTVAATPTITPLPALASATPTSATDMGAFLTETVLPTITPLPPIIATATASATLVAPTLTATLTAMPLIVKTIAPTPTYTPTALPSLLTTVTSALAHGGFPTETPVATITPLPAISPQVTPTP